MENAKSENQASMNNFCFLAIWKSCSVGSSFGHIALITPNCYISFWPNCDKKGHIKGEWCEPKLYRTHEEEVKANGIPEYVPVFGLDENAITLWWNEFIEGKPKYHLQKQNCSDIVYKALCRGNPWFEKNIGECPVKTPKLVYETYVKYGYNKSQEVKSGYLRVHCFVVCLYKIFVPPLRILCISREWCTKKLYDIREWYTKKQGPVESKTPCSRHEPMVSNVQEDRQMKDTSNVIVLHRGMNGPGATETNTNNDDTDVISLKEKKSTELCSTASGDISHFQNGLPVKEEICTSAEFGFQSVRSKWKEAEKGDAGRSNMVMKNERNVGPVAGTSSTGVGAMFSEQTGGKPAPASFSCSVKCVAPRSEKEIKDQKIMVGEHSGDGPFDVDEKDNKEIPITQKDRCKSHDIQLKDEPSAPGVPEVRKVGKDIVLQTWAKPSSDGSGKIISYLVDKREHGNEDWTRVNQQPCTANMIGISNLMEDRRHKFCVFAENDAGISPPSVASDSINTVSSFRYNDGGVKPGLNHEEHMFKKRQLHVKGKHHDPVAESKGVNGGANFEEMTKYTLDKLQVPKYELPEGVDPLYKEMYLTAEDFQKTFGMSYTDFLGEPRWKQLEMKKEAKVF